MPERDLHLNRDLPEELTRGLDLEGLDGVVLREVFWKAYEEMREFQLTEYGGNFAELLTGDCGGMFKLIRERKKYAYQRLVVYVETEREKRALARNP